MLTFARVMCACNLVLAPIEFLVGNPGTGLMNGLMGIFMLVTLSNAE